MITNPAAWTRGPLAALFVAAMLLAGTDLAATPAAAADALVQIPGNVDANLGAGDREGDADPAQPLQLQLALRLRDQAGLDDLISRVSTPGSPQYGQYLTPEHIGSLFGPTEAQVASAVTYLQANGFRVTHSAPGSVLIDAAGSIGQAEYGMHTTIGLYRDRATGREFYANDGPPSLPSSLASIVQGALGLNNHEVRHHAAQPRVCCAGTPYGPAQIRSGYGFTGSPISALTGSGQTLGLLELDSFSQSNITNFDTTYGLTPPAPVVEAVDSGIPGGQHSNGGETEVELDVEVMQGIAPGAGILVFEGPNTDAGVNDTYACMTNPAALGVGGCPNYASGATGQANSSSWGLCEQLQGSTETNALHSIFSQAAAAGKTVFAASGDAGAFDCRNPNNPTDPTNPFNNTLAVDSPASDPYVTGTGGTKLTLNTDGSYNSETAWPAEPNAFLGGGGGLSTIFTTPSWQTGAGVNNAFSNGNRQVPDVSLDADPDSGYRIYSCTASVGSCKAGWIAVGGTSAAAPGWAAFAAIANQYAMSQCQPLLGFVNPKLYAAAQAGTGYTAYNDVTTGTNSNNAPYTVSTGWDYLTGWGSPRADSLAQTLTGLSLSLASVNPSLGPSNGGNTVNISGTGFRPTCNPDGSLNTAPTVTFDPGGAANLATVISATTTQLQVVAPAHAVGIVGIQVTNPAATGAAAATLNTAYTYQATRSYHPLTPYRILDTRPPPFNVGGQSTLSQGEVRPLQVTGGQVASTAVAVVLNVTVTNPWDAGYLTLYPTGASLPNASNLNFTAGQTVPNLVEVGVGTGGSVNIFASATTDVVVDVEGWVASAAIAGDQSGYLQPLPPTRVMDTRQQLRTGSCNGGAACTTLGPGQSLDLQVAGAGGVPATGANAVVVNVTEAVSTAPSYLTVYPTGAPRPNASNLNFVAGQVVANRVMVGLGSGGSNAGRITVYNAYGSTDVVIDVGGWFSDGSASATHSVSTASLVYTPLAAPLRVLDSRGSPFHVGPLSTFAPNSQGNLPMSVNVPASARAVVLNATATDTTAPGVLTAWPGPAGSPLPSASDLNWTVGLTVPNLVVVQLGADLTVNLANESAGSTDMVVDLEGYYS